MPRQLIDDAEVPLVRLAGAGPEAGQVNGCAVDAQSIAQMTGHTVAQARLSHLTRCQNVAELTSQQGLRKLLVSASLQVEVGLLQSAACLECEGFSAHGVPIP